MEEVTAVGPFTRHPGVPHLPWREPIGRRLFVHVLVGRQRGDWPKEHELLRTTGSTQAHVRHARFPVELLAVRSVWPSDFVRALRR